MFRKHRFRSCESLNVKSIIINLWFPDFPQYFHKVVKQLLPMAYSLLKRNLFGEILEAHLSSRSHDDLDQLSAQEKKKKKKDSEVHLSSCFSPPFVFVSCCLSSLFLWWFLVLLSFILTSSMTFCL